MRATFKTRLWTAAFAVLTSVTATEILGLSNPASGQETLRNRRGEVVETSEASARTTSPQDANLTELRDEVRALRQEVQRVLQLLESQAPRTKIARPKTSGQGNRGTAVEGKKDTSLVYAKTYAVVDLVAPLQPARSATIDNRGAAAVPAAPRADFGPLEELIMSHVAPDSWERAGGDATIQRFPNNLSLVISQTQQNHEKIATLFEKLRRGHERIILETRIITQANAEQYGLEISGQKARTLSFKEASSLAERAQSDRQANLIQSPVISIPAGQVANIRLPVGAAGELHLLIHAQVEDDSDAIRLGLAVNANDAVEALRSNTSILVRKGQAMIVDLTERLANNHSEQDLSLAGRLRSAESTTSNTANTARTLLVVTPKIEYEELLGIPSTP